MSVPQEQFQPGPVPPSILALTAGELEPLLLRPARVGLPSSWWGHVPFAHWLVHEIRPRVVVELGTHHGISFSAFCNAVRHGGLTTRCYAVDTWKGDEQNGFYDESVFDNISAFVAQTYASFATLLRRPFDEAVGLFADGSIDLLHIDGLHTYEAVRADFEAWRPKLSDRAVVLFHDTAIYECGFGVWRFWQELAPRHPSFTFCHGCGLGVLAPGTAPPPFVAALAEMSPAYATTLRLRVAELGDRWIAIDQRARDEATIRVLTQGAAETAQLRQRSLIDAEMARQTVAALLEETGRQRTRLEALAADSQGLRQQVAAATWEANRLRAQLEQVRTSTSWRVTGPYRAVGRVLRRRVLAPLAASAAHRQQLCDAREIARAHVFDAAFYLGRDLAPGYLPGGVDDAIMDYLAASRAGMPRSRQNAGAPRRRPMPGFHPLAYAASCADYDEATGEDPLAHYLRTGRPKGPWTHSVIQPPPSSSGLTGAASRIAVHAHFHYPDLLGGLLSRLRANASWADLFITTTSETRAAEIGAILASHDRAATTVVVPNRGRDIGPLLMHHPELAGYDVIGHLHGKRSPQQSTVEGDNWREFLWDHLVGRPGSAPGSGVPMMDVIAAAFVADAGLGLVFPEDPNLNHWDMNQELAEELAGRLGLALPLPPHFEFPKGGMFWARPAALQPLAGLGWSWDDFPPEPVASDGTVLHALERLVPFSAERAGLGFACVHLFGSWRIPTSP